MYCGIPPRGIKVHVRTFSAWVGLVAVVSTLAGCGSDTDSPPGTTNLNAAVTALLRQPRSYTLYDGGYQSAILSISQGATASYKGVNYDTTQLTTTIRSGGVLISTDVQTVWFQSGTMLEFFIQNSSNGCDLATSAAKLGSTRIELSVFQAEFLQHLQFTGQYRNRWHGQTAGNRDPDGFVQSDLWYSDGMHQLGQFVLQIDRSHLHRNHQRERNTGTSSAGLTRHQHGRSAVHEFLS
jgi:hypothetical protein